MKVSFRLVLWLVLLCALDGIPASAQCPQQTSVTDTIFNADGSLAEGRVVIAWPTFQAGSCQVVAGQVSVAITAGALAVPLYPNDAATPTGTSYRVTYHLKSGRITTEYWVVPSNAMPVSLAVVRSPSVPVPAVMVSQAQVTNLVPNLARKVELPAPCAPGKFLQANGSANPPQVNCVDGTGAPLASPTQSGTVKTDVSEADPLVYSKATIDGLLAGKAAASHAHSAADTTSGVFDPARIPAPSATTLGGVRSDACSGTDKMSGISTTGVILCGSDQTGGGGSASQHQVNGTNLSANDPVNFQDTAAIAFANPSTGNVQAALKDSSITAANLAAANPSSVQLSGIDDDNIAASALSPNRVAGTAEVQSNKGAASGYASLSGSALVVQNPANSQVAPAASKIPVSDGAGKLDDGWLSSNVSLLGSSVSLTTEVTGTLPILSGGTNQTTWIASRCVQVNTAGTGLESAPTPCGSGGAGYDSVQEDGTDLPQRSKLNFRGSAFTATDDAAGSRTNVDVDTDLEALANLAANGMVTRTAAGSISARTITGTMNEMTVSNGDGIAGNPTLSIPATLDLGGKTSIVVPKAAGAAPTGDGDIRYDTTQDTLKGGGAGGITGSYPRVLKQARPIETKNNTTTADQDFVSLFTIPANYLEAGRCLQVDLSYQYTTDSNASSQTYYLKLGATKVSSVGAGTPVNSTTRSFLAVLVICGTAAAGASVAVETATGGFGNFTASSSTSSTGQPVNLATDGTLNIVPGVAFGTSTSGESVVLRLAVIRELIGP